MTIEMLVYSCCCCSNVVYVVGCRRQVGCCMPAKMTGSILIVLCGRPKSTKKVTGVCRWYTWRLLVDANW